METMRILLAGGSGFLGNALRRSLERDGHSVVNLTRSRTPQTPNDVTWVPDGTSGEWAQVIDSRDAVINLAGQGLADGRWNAARRQAILTSRLLPTRSLVAAITRAATPPRVLVSASGINYYGPHGDEIVTEATAAGTDFLADLCVQWEREAEQASTVTRVALVRSGLVLHRTGGVLPRMLLPFRIGVGGRIGSGSQYMPWIHRDDWVQLVRWMIDETEARGAFNGCAPNPVTNATFADALGRALHRPAVLPVPAFALRLAFGEMADLLLTGQRALPPRATQTRIEFRFHKIDDAFSDLLRVS
jgi:uncharacterized protein (TIGR01777 family)